MFALCRFDPVEHRDPFRHAVQRRKSFAFEQAGELEAVAESQRPGDGLCRGFTGIGQLNFNSKFCLKANQERENIDDYMEKDWRDYTEDFPITSFNCAISRRSEQATSYRPPRAHSQNQAAETA